MEINPDYVREKELEKARWRKKISSMKEKCLAEMQGYIPSYVFSASKSILLADGLSTAFVKRLMTKKCLWLVRLEPEDISKLHVAELQSKYSVVGNCLDLVELIAIYAALPHKFMNDFDGKKINWFESVETAVRDSLSMHESGRLTKDKQRHSVYDGLPRLYSSDTSLHRLVTQARAEGETSSMDMRKVMSNEKNVDVLRTDKPLHLPVQIGTSVNNAKDAIVEASSNCFNSKFDQHQSSLQSKVSVVKPSCSSINTVSPLPDFHLELRAAFARRKAADS